jgi:hypothetical protein
VKEAEGERLIAIVDMCLKALALAQKKAEVRQVISKVEANGDVIISTLVDGKGQSSAPYARIDHRTGQLTRLGQIVREIRLGRSASRGSSFPLAWGAPTAGVRTEGFFMQRANFEAPRARFSAEKTIFGPRN